MKNTSLAAGLLLAISSLHFTVPADPVTLPENSSPSLFADIQASQPSPAFVFLRGHKNGRKGYGLQWSLTSNQGMAYYQVQATYEDPTDPYSNWYNLGTLPNARGNLFQFQHIAMWPGTIHYRVLAYARGYAEPIISPIHTTVVR